MRVVMVGAGGVGGYLGVRLAEQGEEIAWLVRERHVEPLTTRGIALESPLGNVALEPQRASARATELGRADLLIVTVKLYDLASVARQLAPLVDDETIVLPLENGVEAHDIIAAHVRTQAVLKGMVTIKSHLRAPGDVVCKSAFCRIRFGEPHGAASARARRLADLFNACTGVEASTSEDMDADLWRKFVMLASFSAVSCVARASIGEVLADRAAHALLVDATREAATVGRALGIALPADIVELVASQTRDMPKDGRPSMLEDLEAGRPLELDYFSGAIVRLGEKAGVATPIHAIAARALAMHARGGRMR